MHGRRFCMRWIIREWPRPSTDPRLALNNPQFSAFNHPILGIGSPQFSAFNHPILVIKSSSSHHPILAIKSESSGPRHQIIQSPTPNHPILLPQLQAQWYQILLSTRTSSPHSIPDSSSPRKTHSLTPLTTLEIIGLDYLQTKVLKQKLVGGCGWIPWTK